MKKNTASCNQIDQSFVMIASQLSAAKKHINHPALELAQKKLNRSIELLAESKKMSFALIVCEINDLVETLESYTLREIGSPINQNNLKVLKDDVNVAIKFISTSYDLLSYVMDQFDKNIVTPASNDPAVLLSRVQIMFAFDRLTPRTVLKLFEDVQQNNWLPEKVIAQIVIPCALAQQAKNFLAQKVNASKINQQKFFRPAPVINVLNNQVTADYFTVKNQYK